MYDLSAFTTPARIYHAPGQMYYYQGDDWYGLEQLGAAFSEKKQSAVVHAVRFGTGAAVTGGLIYAHRKKDIDWYCSVLASLVWGGIAAEVTARLTGYILAATQSEEEV